ncbi:MAG: arginine--tRNA ligase [Deltaproteobacteria bacterium]|uniref:Arginine--tRNA ligase n=1 Tax=Candidatus Zymogenus saltonus TaxID=2844893 RepID=A0A9D8KGE7_9DELT|nr:arginine--tRNA ligase [Candidatus Zymogenus saltonus]
MKNKLAKIVRVVISDLKEEGLISTELLPEPQIETPKDQRHGDFASNIAMVLASMENKNPRELADRIAGAIKGNDISDAKAIVKDVKVAGPGFINFTLNDSVWHDSLREVLSNEEDYGRSDVGDGQRVQIEFVSANPTGPLHIGHARGAVVGDVLASILSKAGFYVEREYYINDAGVQMGTLGRSVYSRCLEHFGREVVYPDNYYQGEYIGEIAGKLAEKEGEGLLKLDETEAVHLCADFALNLILDDIKRDLHDFGVDYNVWFSEKGLYEKGQVDESIKKYRDEGIIYEKEGALWFNTTDHGDDKDRVVVKSDGEKTYFASDISYHKDKYDRGFDKVINIWGSDHHGYVVRMKAAVKAMGRDPDDLEIILIQFVNLIRGGKPVSMSTRSGEFITLREVLDEVGTDAMRYFMLMRSYDTHLDFDLDLAKKRSQDNPVYYVQYAHARICSILRQAEEAGMDVSRIRDSADLTRLTLPEEAAVIKKLAEFPETVEEAAGSLEPHRITFYVFELASLFHSYYNHHRVITEDEKLTAARLTFVVAVKTVIKNALTFMGISAPERM